MGIHHDKALPKLLETAVKGKITSYQLGVLDNNAAAEHEWKVERKRIATFATRSRFADVESQQVGL
jgi:hypothetical protein